METKWGLKDGLEHIRIRAESKLLHHTIAYGVRFLQKLRMRLDYLARREREMDDD